MNKADADVLRNALEPLLPDYEVTSVPWSNESPKAEWIVTVWEDDEVLLDLFGFGRYPNMEYVARRVGRGREVFRAKSPEAIATAVKEGAR